MLAPVGLGTWVGHVAPWPTWSIHRTPWEAVGWVLRPFRARARALRIYVSFMGLGSDLARFGDFRRI
jgi:hypothetical protein